MSEMENKCDTGYQGSGLVLSISDPESKKKLINNLTAPQTDTKTRQAKTNSRKILGLGHLKKLMGLGRLKNNQPC